MKQNETDDEIAFRPAVNLLRASVESGGPFPTTAQGSNDTCKAPLGSAGLVLPSIVERSVPPTNFYQAASEHGTRPYTQKLIMTA
jgi:hypothetical protein